MVGCDMRRAFAAQCGCAIRILGVGCLHVADSARIAGIPMVINAFGRDLQLSILDAWAARQTQNLVGSPPCGVILSVLRPRSQGRRKKGSWSLLRLLSQNHMAVLNSRFDRHALRRLRGLLRSRSTMLRQGERDRQLV